MPKNVEIKARVENVEEFKQLAKKLSGEDGTLIEQEDTFFNSPQGYLKLRELKVRILQYCCVLCTMTDDASYSE